MDIILTNLCKDICSLPLENVDKQSNQRQITIINKLNVMCTLMIVILHSTFPWISINTKSPIIDMELNFMRLVTVMVTAALACFWAVSSYLYFLTYSDLSSYREKLQRRVKSVLFPFIFWNAVAYVYYFVVVNYTTLFTNKNVPGTIHGLLQYIWLSEGIPPLWYLRELFLFALIAPLIYFIISLLKENSIILIPFSMFSCYFANIPYGSFVFWLPAIIFGAYCAKYCSGVSKYIKKYIDYDIYIYIYHRLNLYTLLILYLIASLIIFLLYDEKSFLFYTWRFFSAVCVVGIMYRMDLSNFVKYKSISFYCFCTHFVIIEGVRGILVKGIGINELSILPIFVATILFTLGIILVTSYVVQRFAYPVWNLLNGGRGC